MGLVLFQDETFARELDLSPSPLYEDTVRRLLSENQEESSQQNLTMLAMLILDFQPPLVFYYDSPS